MGHGKTYRRTAARATLAICALALAFLLALAAPAPAASISSQRPLLFGFNGHDTTAGAFTHPLQIAIDESSGDVYVLNTAGSGRGEGSTQEPEKRAVDKFNYKGEAQDFVALGESSLRGQKTTLGHAFGVEGFFGKGSLSTGLAVDNSTIHPGRIYVQEESGPVHAFDPEGHYLWTLQREEGGVKVTEGATGIAVDAEGHLWVSAASRNKVLEFDTTVAGKPSSTPLKEVPITHANKQPTGIAFDQSGKDLYVALSGVSPSGVDKYVKNETTGEYEYSETLTSERPFGLAADSSVSAGHVFTIQEGGFREFEANGTEVPGSPFGGGFIATGRGIAYNPAKGWVYVVEDETNRVKVFGPAASGTAPDVTSEATGGIGATGATAHGKINPQGVPNSYHFEWVKGEAQHLAVSATGGRFALSFGGQCTGAIGTGNVTKESNTVEITAVSCGEFKVGDTLTSNGGIPAGTTITGCSPSCSSPATLTISNLGTENFSNRELHADDIPFDAPATPAGCPAGEPACINVQSDLEGLASIGAGNVSVTGSPGAYDVVFKGALAGRRLGGLGGDTTGLTGGEHKITITTVTQGEGWGAAEAQPAPEPQPYPSITPTDGNDHQVSYTLTGLERNTTYDVRLVGTNTEAGKGISSYASPADTFTTIGVEPPEITAGPEASNIATEQAKITATIETEEGRTTWAVRLSAQMGGTTKKQCEELPESAYTTAAQGEIPAGETAPVAIEADLAGLQHAQTYCLRLVAKNNNPQPAVGHTAFRTLPVALTGAETLPAAPRLDTSARLNARIDPEGEALTYRFQWSADGGEHWQPLPDQSDESEAREPIVVGEQLEALTPATTYSYRFSAENPADPGHPVQGGERTFTTRAAAEVTLPAPRGDELVNSPDKGDQHVYLGNVLMARISQPITEDGEEALWSTLSGSPGGNGPGNDAFLARRTGQTAAAPNGWESKTLLPPTAQLYGEGLDGYRLMNATPDFSRFVFEVGSRNVNESAVVRTDRNQHQELLDVLGGAAGYAEVSDNAAHVVLVNGATRQLEDLGAPGAPEALSIMPGGAQSECVGAENNFITGMHAAAVNSLPGYRRIGADGSRVYFEVKPNPATPGGACEGPLGLYVRNREANGGAGKTTLIDPGATIAGVNDEVELIRATPSGRQAYYVTFDKCRKWAQTPPPFSCEAEETADTNSHPDVYRWDEEAGAAGESECITCEAENEAGEKKSDLGLAYAVVDFGSVALPSPVLLSDDFSHLYFASDALLAPGAIAGREHVYALDLRARTVHLVANANGALLEARYSSLSANGDVLVFDGGLAGPPRTLTSDAAAPGVDELYRYDDTDRSLECLSCLRDGETTHDWGGGGGARRGLLAGFGLSADGSTIVFVTAQALLPRDVNNGFDVYEWRNGVLRLITDGVTDFGEVIAVEGVDANGRNVFFMADQPGLTGYEHDGLANLYDARIGGGFPRPVPPAHCSEESCQGPLQAAPALPAGGGNFHGAGNVGEKPSRRCPKGKRKIRRHGRVRCVAKRHRHPHRRHRRRAVHAKQGRSKR